VVVADVDEEVMEVGKAIGMTMAAGTLRLGLFEPEMKAGIALHLTAGGAHKARLPGLADKRMVGLTKRRKFKISWHRSTKPA